MNKTTLKTFKQIYKSLDFALRKATPLLEKFQGQLDNMPENPSNEDIYIEIEGNIDELEIAISSIENAIESVSSIVPPYFFDRWRGCYTPEQLNQIYPPHLYPNNGEDELHSPKKRSEVVKEVKPRKKTKPSAASKASRKGKKN